MATALPFQHRARSECWQRQRGYSTPETVRQDGRQARSQ